MFNSRFKTLKDLQDAFPTEQHCQTTWKAEDGQMGMSFLLLTLHPKSTNAKIINIAAKPQVNTSMLKQS